MRIIEGDRLRDTFTKQLYKVKIIINGTVLLEAENMLDKVWLDEESLKLFYEMVENKKNLKLMKKEECKKWRKNYFVT